MQLHFSPACKARDSCTLAFTDASFFLGGKTSRYAVQAGALCRQGMCWEVKPPCEGQPFTRAAAEPEGSSRLPTSKPLAERWHCSL